MASVTLDTIRKVYDGTTEIIKGVDLEIRDGEFLVLVGPSGCGKSTLLRLIAGLEEITSGEMKIGEHVVNDVAPRDRGVAMVFQSYALYPHMSVFENMAFGLRIRKEPAESIDRRIREVAALLDLTPYLDRLPKQLSGGQRQRVAIGRAIVRDPDVFLFDEPLSNLDAALRTQMRVELKKLHRRLGTTMIYVTHDQVEAMTLADRIAILETGVVQQVGTPAELYETPANRFVAGFIGSPSMNFLEVAYDPGRDALVAEGIALPFPRAEVTRLVGVRPHHLELLEFGGAGGPGNFRARVDVVEPMGWEAYVHAHVGAQPLVAHVRSEQLGHVRPGEEVVFGVAPEHVHLFDPSGARIEVG